MFPYYSNKKRWGFYLTLHFSYFYDYFDFKSAKVSCFFAKAFLIENPKVKLVLKDSYAVGNCEPWTKGFINAFGLDEQWMFAKDLLKHKHLDRMMKESRFRAILLKKVLEAHQIV